MSNVTFARGTWPSIVGRTSYSGWLLYILLGVAISFGAIYTWIAATNHSMNADGISYLDIGDAYLRGDWEMAINSVWSPMYAWVLGLVLWLVKPGMRWEFPIVQLVNFSIYLITLLCFAFFWRQTMRYHRQLPGYLKQRFAFAFNTMRSYLNKSHWRPERKVSPVRSFNPLRTFLGVSFSTIMSISFTILIIALATGNRYSLLFAVIGLAALILEVLVHSSFLFFLARRQGTTNTLSYIPLLIAIDIAYTNGVIVGTIAGLLDRFHIAITPSPVHEVANYSELLDTEDE